MPDSERLRFTTRDFQPASFAERGTHVPFTSPMLAHARLRISARGAREVVIRNPGGGEGWYVGQWHSMIDAARLSVHDRLLYRRIEAAEAVDPLGVRRTVREVALEGFAGRQARDAAEAALTAEANALFQTHRGLLRRLLRQAGLAEAETRLAEAQSAEALAHMAPGLLAALQQAAGTAAETLAERAATLAAELAPLGLAGAEEGHLGRDLAGLGALNDALDGEGGDPGQAELHDADPVLVMAVQRSADTIIREAEAARGAALAGTDRPLALLAEGEAAIQRCARQVQRLAWLLDGWPALIAVWTLARPGGGPGLRRALSEIAMNLPPTPRASDAQPQPAVTAVAAAAPPRFVRAGQDWLTGVAERDLVARHEMLLARAL